MQCVDNEYPPSMERLRSISSYEENNMIAGPLDSARIPGGQ